MKIFKYINRVVSIILDIVFILLLVSVYRMGLIPVKYLVILSVFVVVFGKEILDDLNDLFQTNLSTDTIKKYARNQIDTMSKWNAYNEAVTDTTVSTYMETYSMQGIKLCVTIPNEESRKDVSNIINELLKKVSNEKD